MDGSEQNERGARWQDFMISAQRGEQRPYEQLLQEMLPYLRGMVGALLRDASASEDVIQNILLAVHRARHTYRPERPYLPWLRAVARNAVIDQQRIATRRTRREVSYEETDVEFEAEEPSRLEAPLSDSLRSALEQLPDAQRQAVELLQVEGLSVAEAAERLGISASALKVRAHRGYKRLRKQLAEGTEASE